MTKKFANDIAEDELAEQTARWDIFVKYHGGSPWAVARQTWAKTAGRAGYITKESADYMQREVAARDDATKRFQEQLAKEEQRELDEREKGRV